MLPSPCAYQALELLRLQLPVGPISALLALRQLQIQSTILSGAVAGSTKVCVSFGRLVISLVADLDFRRSMDAFGSAGSVLALRAVHLQLERCISSVPKSDAMKRLDLGTLCILQGQASAQRAQLASESETDLEDCVFQERFELMSWKSQSGFH